MHFSCRGQASLVMGVKIPYTRYFHSSNMTNFSEFLSEFNSFMGLGAEKVHKQALFTK